MLNYGSTSTEVQVVEESNKKPTLKNLRETALKTIEPEDITRGKYHEIVSRSFAEVSLDFFGLSVFGYLFLIFGIIFLLLGVAGYIFAHGEPPRSIVLGLMFLFPISAAYTVHRIRHFFKSRKTLKDPSIQIERLLYGVVPALNQRVKMAQLLEKTDSLSSDEKERVYQGLVASREDVEKKIKRLREIRRKKKELKKLRKESSNTDTQLGPPFTTGATEIDILLEGGAIAREWDLVESEQELDTQLQTLLAEVSA